jgi:hypothetical protein
MANSAWSPVAVLALPRSVALERKGLRWRCSSCPYGFQYKSHLHAEIRPPGFFSETVSFRFGRFSQTILRHSTHLALPYAALVPLAALPSRFPTVTAAK